MSKKSHKVWTQDEIDVLIDLVSQKKTCEYIAKSLSRTTKSVQHKFHELGLQKPVAKIGDVINGWKIINIYTKQTNTQQIRMADVESVINDKKATYKLTQLTNNKVGWPDRRRPDNILRNSTHNDSQSRLYHIWYGMKNRCYNTKQYNYQNYGAKGIVVCDSWLEKYENFREWSHANGYSDELTLDRIDPNGNYCPENCRWATWVETFEITVTQPSERQSNKLILIDWLQQKYPHIYDEFVAG